MIFKKIFITYQFIVNQFQTIIKNDTILYNLFYCLSLKLYKFINKQKIIYKSVKFQYIKKVLSNNKKMFFFGTCCQSFQTGEGFQIRKGNMGKQVQFQFSHDLKKFSKDLLEKQNNQVIKIKKSQYEEIHSQYKGSNKMWLDHQFPPERQSLGNLKIQHKWKRISQIVNHPTLLSQNLNCLSILDYNNQQKCQIHPFLYSITILAQRQDIIQNLFLGQQFSKNGLYKVPLKIDGQIQQIMVDDYIPISSNGGPIFSSPINNQIWLLILQKAWAKVLSSYDQLNGNPLAIFKAFSWAPCEQYYIKQSNQDRQRSWRKLLSISGKKYPISCQTHDYYIKSNKMYSLLDAFVILDKNDKQHRIVKLRSLLKNSKQLPSQYQDPYIHNKLLQRQKQQSQTLWQKYRIKQNSQDVFYLSFNEFRKYFYKFTICLYEKKSNYISQILQCNFKNGVLHKFYVKKQGNYSIEIHQPTNYNQKKQEIMDNYRRGTIILIKDQENQFHYVDGILSLNQKDVLLSAELTPGKYLIYSKFDHNQQITSSNKFFISIYSKHFTQLIEQQRKNYPDILQKVFLNHGRQNKRNEYNNDLMWISYKLIYKQGGYAYIAIGNQQPSNKKFIITFDQKDFRLLNFKLKKPYKNKQGIQTLEVLPGQKKIILARIINNVNNIKSLKFPPPLGIKMEPIQN